MIQVRESDEFISWMGRLSDRRARLRIAARIARLAAGNPGDAKSVGGRIMELRVDYGPGYRVYYMRQGQTIVVMLCGGDKRTQREDIRRAAAIAEELESER
jgi:putative addiction module killer protein